jgi:hypothetical protein
MKEPSVRRQTNLVLLGSGLFCCTLLASFPWLSAQDRTTRKQDDTAKPAARDEKDDKDKKKVRSVGLTVTPLPKWFEFESKDTVNGWIANDDSKAITAHAWELWGALTTLTEQKLGDQFVPIYETWWDAEEALLLTPKFEALKVKKGVRRFKRPVQFQHNDRAVVRTNGSPSGRPIQTLFDEVKYNDEIKQFISANKYNDHANLDKINADWAKDTAIADRKLKDFPDKSVMLKPVYRAVSGTAITILPYWAGPVNSTTSATPGPNTWTKKMAIVPPEAGVTKNFRLRESGEDLALVKVTDFYHIKLTKKQVAELGPRFEEGDYMLLVGMHVSSREIDNWTWQTFWWSFNKPSLPVSAKKRVKAPFDHYQVAVGYSFMTGRDEKGKDNPNSLPTVCYNPYLEAGFGNTVFVRPNQLGIQSNCMSCHRCAAWPATTKDKPNSNYVGNGIVDPGDPALFADKTKTDFLWGVADGRP